MATLDVFRGYLLSDVFKYYVCSLVCLKISTLFNMFDWDVACRGTLLLCRKKWFHFNHRSSTFLTGSLLPPILIVFYNREDISLMPIFDDHRRDPCRTLIGSCCMKNCHLARQPHLYSADFFLGGGAREIYWLQQPATFLDACEATSLEFMERKYVKAKSL